jgi:hypothetical protein
MYVCASYYTSSVIVLFEKLNLLLIDLHMHVKIAKLYVLSDWQLKA